MLVDTDVRNLTGIMRSLMFNTAVLEIHQSTATPPGRFTGLAACGGELDVKTDARCQIWARRLDEVRGARVKEFL